MNVVDKDTLLKCCEFVHGRWDNRYVREVDIINAPTFNIPNPGYWKKCEENIEYVDGNSFGYFWYECSECGGRPLRNEFNCEEVLSAYCPWCGAELGVQDEET